jgi:hypothetical protein
MKCLLYGSFTKMCWPVLIDVKIEQELLRHIKKSYTCFWGNLERSYSVLPEQNILRKIICRQETKYVFYARYFFLPLDVAVFEIKKNYFQNWRQKKRESMCVFWFTIWGSHSGSYEKLYLLLKQWTFRKNMLPQSSGSKNKPKKKPAWSP